MKTNEIAEIFVYGAEDLCPSCVHLPSSKDTFEWLQAAINRKFPDQAIAFSYVDIYNPPENKAIRDFAQKIIDEDRLYPVVVINGEIIGEGNPSLKHIFSQLKNNGYKEA